MKIAFVGKGGSGKTTLASLVCQYLLSQKLPVLAIDADINQHLATALGLPKEVSEAVPAMGLHIDTIKDYLRGTNPRITDSARMVKTTPPGEGSRLLTLTQENHIFRDLSTSVGTLRFMAVGPFADDDIGVKCYHAKTGSVELLLNHLIDYEREYVVVDMTAGADSFASGLFTRFDVTWVVVEPTVKSISVYEQYKQYAQGYGVCIRVVGNKVEGEEDKRFLKDAVGDDLVATISASGFVRAMEKGNVSPLSKLEEENLVAIKRMVAEVDAREKDWDSFYGHAVAFHAKNAIRWANEAVGADVTQQIDPSFSLTDAIVRMESAHTL